MLRATSQYNTSPVSIARTPFQGPITSTDGITFASCIQDRNANIIPKAEMNNQKTSNRSRFSGAIVDMRSHRITLLPQEEPSQNQVESVSNPWEVHHHFRLSTSISLGMLSAYGSVSTCRVGPVSIQGQ